jgi:ribosomal protein S18 acetylase RimI-like enzyme
MGQARTSLPIFLEKDGHWRTVALTPQLEFLDLRHFRALDIRALLDEENGLWKERLLWDHSDSSRLLMQYVDSRLLVGYVALDQGKVCGYTFSVQEQAKAVIGGVFATRAAIATVPATAVEGWLLDHLLETLCHTPGLERMEAQFLLHPHDAHRFPFEKAGFRLFPRLFLELDLQTGAGPRTPLYNEVPLLDGALRMRRWRDADFGPAASTIANAYAGHIDSEINDQYHSIAGAQNFLHNIVRFPGCGLFEPDASWVVQGPQSGNLLALLLSSRVSPEVGHITQVCVSPELQGKHIGRALMDVGAASLRQLGCKAVTLTVTEANHTAVGLYRRLGYHTRHIFDAMLWTH